MKKISAIFVILALSLLVVKPVSAQEAIAVDFNGGLFMNDNSGMVFVDSHSLANSGGNTVGDEAGVTSGSASAQTDVDNGMNSNSLTGGITDSNAGPTAYNEDVEGSPLAIAIDANLVGVINFNRGIIGDRSLALANSGSNIGGEESIINSGPASADTDTDSDLNTNTTNVTITDENETGPLAANVDFDGDGVAVAADVNGVLVANLNVGGVCNFSVAGANSGFNYAGEESSLETDAATASTGTSTDLNSNDTTVAISTAGNGSTAANIDFDECSSEVAVAVDVNAVLVLNSNFGGVANFSVAGANSGGNSSGEESVVVTGAAVASTTTATSVNQNTTSVTITDNSNGPVAVNAEDDEDFDPCDPYVPGPCEEDGCQPTGGCSSGQNSGPVAANIDSENGVAVAVDANVAVVANENMGVVSNNSISLANSGANVTGEESTVNTGMASASTVTTSDVNTNDTTIAISTGSDSCVSDCVVEGEGAGPLAVNEDADNGVAVAVDANVVVVSNDNNAVVVNNSTAAANTGDNGSQPDQCEAGGCSCDAEEGSITTGSATATTTTTNNVNTNTTTFTINH